MVSCQLLTRYERYDMVLLRSFHSFVKLKAFSVECRLLLTLNECFGRWEWFYKSEWLMFGLVMSFFLQLLKVI